VLTTRGIKNDVFRISIILHSSLVNLVNEFSASSEGILQYKIDISISKIVDKEGRQSCPCSEVDADNKDKLDSITFGDEDEVVFVLQSQQNPGQVSRLEVILRSTFVHRQVFAGQNSPYLLTMLVICLFSPVPTCSVRGTSYIIDFTSLLLIDIGLSNPSESGK
jgi:hypothetical protein